MNKLLDLWVAGGTYDDQRFEYHSGINAFIGVHGSGKTTHADLIKYCFDNLPSNKQERKEFEEKIDDVLCGGRIEIKIERGDGVQYIISRTHKQDPIVLNENGEVTEIDFKSQKLIDIEIYSLKDIKKIALDEKAQLKLIDKFEFENIEKINKEINVIYKSIDSNTVEIKSLESDNDSIEKINSELKVLQDSVRQLNDKIGIDSNDIDFAAKNQIIRSNENSALNRITEDISEAKEFYEEKLSSLSDSLADISDQYDSNSKNKEIFSLLFNNLHVNFNAIEGKLKDIIKVLDESSDNLGQQTSIIKNLHLQQEHEDRKIIERNTEIRQAVVRRSQLLTEVQTLLEKKKQVEITNQKREQLLQERRVLQERLSDLRDERSNIRIGITEKINKELDGVLKVTIDQFAQCDTYEKKLSELLKGESKTKYKMAAKNIAESVHPFALINLIKDRDIDGLMSKGISKTHAVNVINALSDSDKYFQLDNIQIDDRTVIELYHNGILKPTNILSDGQKSHAILPLILLNDSLISGKKSGASQQYANPIGFDEPEGHLDNEFIYSQICKSMMATKSCRQVFVISHNPNLLVLSYSDRFFVMQSDGISSIKSKQGSLEECIDDVIGIMEGGEEALSKRIEIYKKVKGELKLP